MCCGNSKIYIIKKGRNSLIEIDTSEETWYEMLRITKMADKGFHSEQ